MVRCRVLCRVLCRESFRPLRICAFEVANEARRCADGPIGQLLQSGRLLGRPVMSIDPVSEMVVRLEERRSGDANVTGKLRMSVAPETFRQIPRR